MHKHNLVVLLAFVSMLSACITTSKPNSGFLTNYENFRPGPKGGVDQIWTSDSIKNKTDFNKTVGQYSKILIDQIWVSQKTSEAYDGIDPTELSNLAKLLEAELRASLSKSFVIVKQPGLNVLRLSIGLTGVESPNQVLAATSTILPVGIGISTVSRLVTGEHTNVGSATIELVASDSISGQAIFAAIDRRAGSKDFKKIVDPLSDAKKAFKFWAERLLKTLQSAKNS